MVSLGPRGQRLGRGDTAQGTMCNLQLVEQIKPQNPKPKALCLGCLLYSNSPVLP